MAFHAVRSLETKAYMQRHTHEYYLSLPWRIRVWIDGKGGWSELPVDGFWFLRDSDLWAMGYPKCK